MFFSFQITDFWPTMFWWVFQVLSSITHGCCLTHCIVFASSLSNKHTISEPICSLRSSIRAEMHCFPCEQSHPLKWKKKTNSSKITKGMEGWIIQRYIQKNHNAHGNVPYFYLFYSSQTGTWCSTWAIPSGKGKALLLSHELGKGIHKQRKPHICNKKLWELIKYKLT